ncbi:MBL fold metallo-hydrolase [Candidatus Binatus sp.]|uniref:MBL fold metallo-hydrolase n=1 Tax=Candidatus Binatus sp. TaxID=2811406 RepID=UPI003C475CF5
MSRSAKRLTACGAALVLLAGLAWWMAHVPAVQDALLRRMVERTLGATRNDLLADNALRVVLCGTGNPLPDPNRADACTAVLAGGNMYLVDAGPGSWKNLALWHLPAPKLAAVMLTHYHSDHIGDLGDINMQTWAQGRANPLRVFGPPGVEQVVGGFAQAYALDRDYRVAHHGAALMPPANWTMEPHVVKIDAEPGAAPCAGGSATVLEENGLKVTAFTVNHAPVVPAYGYRFDYKGRSVVISGDTTKCANLVAQARGADLLIHEAQSATMVKLIEDAASRRGNARVAKIMSDILRYHTTPEDAAAEANQAGVRLLVLSHIGPPTPNAFVRMSFMRGVGAVRPRGVVLGYDGMLLTLPAGSDTIDISSVN